jgi:hypothetical protein
LVDERERTEAKRAQIRQAYLAATQTKPEADPAYHREQQLRRDNFAWKLASTANTLDSYHQYLQQFPQGKYSAVARQIIETLSKASTQTNR